MPRSGAGRAGARPLLPHDRVVRVRRSGLDPGSHLRPDARRHPRSRPPPTAAPTPAPAAPVPWGTNGVKCSRPLGSFPVAGVPEHLQWARLLAELVALGVANSTYAHTAGPVYWGNHSCNAYYTSVTDCNGFVSAALHQAYNLIVPPPPGFDHAYASTYWNAIRAGRFGFRPVRAVSQTRAGDVVAFDYLYGLNESLYLGIQNSGHLAIVNVPPVPIDPLPPVVPGTLQWSVGVIDQTSDPHGASDSRYGRSVGLGTGYMRLYSSATDDRIAGYAWSFSNASLFYRQDGVRSVAIGRLL